LLYKVSFLNYFTGDDCEDDFDGCTASPCSLKRTCQSLTADEQKKQNRSHVCGPCPTGFETDNEAECIGTILIYFFKYCTADILEDIYEDK
jgi:hypothetical protein